MVGGHKPCLSGRQALVPFLEPNLGVGTDLRVAGYELSNGVAVSHLASL